jgi:hypothetical protein
LDRDEASSACRVFSAMPLDVLTKESTPNSS